MSGTTMVPTHVYPRTEACFLRRVLSLPGLRQAMALRTHRHICTCVDVELSASIDAGSKETT